MTGVHLPCPVRRQGHCGTALLISGILLARAGEQQSCMCQNTQGRTSLRSEDACKVKICLRVPCTGTALTSSKALAALSSDGFKLIFVADPSEVLILSPRGHKGSIVWAECSAEKGVCNIQLSVLSKGRGEEREAFVYWWQAQTGLLADPLPVATGHQSGSF